MERVLTLVNIDLLARFLAKRGVGLPIQILKTLTVAGRHLVPWLRKGILVGVDGARVVSWLGVSLALRLLALHKTAVVLF